MPKYGNFCFIVEKKLLLSYISQLVERISLQIQQNTSDTYKSIKLSGMFKEYISFNFGYGPQLPRVRFQDGRHFSNGHLFVHLSTRKLQLNHVINQLPYLYCRNIDKDQIYTKFRFKMATIFKMATNLSIFALL